MEDERFGKEYKLCSKKVIAELISDGRRVKAYPLGGAYLKASYANTVPFQVLISVPKRSFKLAVDRNKIKRQIREVIRLNKSIIEEYLQATNEQWAISIIYRQKETIPFDVLQKKIQKLLYKMIEDAKNQ